DAVSWSVLVEDLASAYRQALEGRASVELPARTDSFQAWSLALRRYADRMPPEERAYWEQVDRSLAGVPTPGDEPAAPGRNRDSASMGLVLPAERTQPLLGEANRAYGTQTGELVLVAFTRALKTWMGGNRFALAMEGHGRTPSLMGDLDVSRTVGWFTCVYPLVLELAEREDVSLHIKQVKESLRQVPSQGVGHGVLRSQRGTLLSAQEPRISFNYLGQSGDGVWPAPFASASEFAGTLQHPEAPRLFALDVLASVENGRLQVELSYDSTRFTPDRMRALVEALRQQLELVTTHCVTRDAPELTPSDIDYAGMSIDELDAVMNAITAG
ncbi:MAG: condensation domain-containing protein, partial [Cystobacter sp.]